MECPKKRQMMLLRVLILLLCFTAEISVADDIATRRAYQSLFGSKVTQIKGGYFNADVSPVGKKKYNEFRRLFDQFANHPDLSKSTPALEKAFAFYVKHKEGVSVGCGGETQNSIKGDWIVVTDYTLPITVPRQFYINVKTGQVIKAYAAHGSGSNRASATSPVQGCPAEHIIECSRGGRACAIPISFDNDYKSYKTQTGFYLAGTPYKSTKATFNNGVPPSGGPNAIKLKGAQQSTRNWVVDPRTGQKVDRAVRYHRSSYTNRPDQAPNACGFSWGCPSTDPQTFESIKRELVEDTLFYNHTLQEELTVNPSC